MNSRISSSAVRKQSKFSAYSEAFKLADYTIRITGNTKRFPKSIRYTLTDRLLNDIYDLTSYVLIATKYATMKRPDYELIQNELKKALNCLAKAESKALLCRQYASPKNFPFWMKLFVNVEIKLEKWLSYTNKKLKKEADAFINNRAYKTESSLKLLLELSEPRDSEGFIELIHTENCVLDHKG